MEFMTNAEMITIPTLTKLLVIKIVARRRSGDSRQCRTIRDLFVPFFSRYDKSVGESEKKATSDPDTSAEPISKIITHISATMMPGVTGVNVASINDEATNEYGSVSKPGIGFIEKIRMGGRRLPQDLYLCW
jgi:hypothetical protein